MALIVLDPGCTRAGLAVYVDGELTWAVDLRTRYGRMPGRVRAALGARLGTGHLVCEYPVRYRDRRDAWREVDAMRALVRGLEGAWPRGACTRYTPRAWKGQAPKPVIHARAAAVLTPPERAVTRGLGPDALDAVALGLVHLGRLAGSP